MKTILIPTDFSDCANNAFDFGVQLASKIGGRIQLIHIVEAPSTQSFSTMGMVGLRDMERLFFVEKRDEANSRIVSIIKEMGQANSQVDSKVIECGAYDSISEIITRQKADIIIMGTRGSNGLNEIITGSNTEKVVRQASCPVISVPSKINLKNLKRIVFATDVTNLDSKIAMVAKELQFLLGINLEILWVHTPHVIESEAVVKKMLESFASEYGFKNHNIHIKKSITVEEGILTFIKEIEADLLFMTTHGRQGISHFLYGSITEEIVNHSSIPVMSVSLNRDN